MKKQLKKLSQMTGLLIAAASYSSYGVAAETNSAPAEVTVKSVFQENLPSGRDPFFPKSTRRAEKSALTAEPVVANPLDHLSLKGISGVASRRFALINNQTLAAGEISAVRIPTGMIKIHCWEISENSVVISIDGSSEKKELRLRDGQ